MKRLLPLFLIVPLLLVAGCSSTNTGPMTHAAFRAVVTLGEQYALEEHPEAVPWVRAATPVVCAVANGTNVSAAQIVAELEKAGVTNASARTVINGSLAIFNVVVAGIGTNQTELRLYGQDLCAGMEQGLPPFTTAAARAVLAPPPYPHLR